jgi:dipeptidyl aminopeptidase/acylaminoacyl peptidase
MPSPRHCLVCLLCLVPVVAAADKRPLTLDDLWALKRVGVPSLSPDGKWAAVEVTSYDMEKNDSTSAVWLLSTDGKRQKQLTTAPGKNSGPRWSPDGKWIAFLRKSGQDDVAQIHVISPDGGEARRVSRMPMAPSAIKWSGDSKTIYCIAWTWPDTPDDDSYRKKEKAEKESKVKALVIDDVTYRYWDHWIADGKRPVVFAVDLDSGKHRNLLAGTGLHLPPLEPSAKSYDVSPDGKELCIVAETIKAMGRDVNLDLYTLALDGKGKPRNLTADNEADDTNPVYSPDGKSLAYLRQTIKHAPECQRLVLHDRESGKNRVLTADLDRSCANPRWSPNGKELCFEAEDRGYENQFFLGVEAGKANCYPSGFSERSQDSARGLEVFVRSSFDLPPTIFSHRRRDKEAWPISFFNDDLVSRWKLGKVESVTFKGAGDEEVQMWLVYPPDFDRKKKWPLVQMVHGGPHSGFNNDFHFRWNAQLWAAQGYVVAGVNFHGSTGFGQKFADSITGDFGSKPMTDIMKATDWLEKQPWIDGKRMAAAGGSYGGYMMAWLNGHTDRFRAMVCHAGVYSYHGQMASDMVRGRERALGAFPWNDLAQVDKQSASRFAANFKTPTLILHGEKDFRVPLTHGLEYYTTLRLKGVPTRLVYFPDENHWILKPQNSRLWHREVFAWLEKYIGHGPTS